MLVDSRAVVLRTIPFRESSLIVTLLTEKHGKTALMARGARRNKNRFGGLLQPGALLECSYYYKPTREVQNLSKVAQMQPTWRIMEDLPRMAICMATLETTEQLCHEHEPMPAVFNFLIKLLTWLHESTHNPSNLFPYILCRMATMAGVGLQSLVENNASEPDAPIVCYLNIESGTLGHAPEGGLHVRLNESQSQYMRCAANGSRGTLLKLSINKDDLRSLTAHLDTYLQYHVEGLKKRRSDAIFEQIL